MENLTVVKSSVLGHMHKIKQIPNQDSIKICGDDSYKFISIADGHGSTSCFRSEIGSDIATEVFKDLVVTNIDRIKSELKNEESKFLAMEVPKRLFLMWSKRVLHHLKENSFQDSEVGELDHRGRAKLGRNALVAYGTTLMGALFVNGKALVWNLGDGDIIGLNNNEVLPLTRWDGKSFANETCSLSSVTSYKDFEYSILDVDDYELVMLSTDGYSNSFSNKKGFYKVLKDLKEIYDKHGIETIENNISTWLSESSKNGSGDDITTGLIFNKKKLSN